jgi:diguanylate cyclase (GGDEF)-like protein
VTAQKEIERELYRLSVRDALTELHNRRGFQALAEQQLKVANRSKTMPALLFIDLDDMKPINDRFGHEAGDRALCETAHILRQTFRDSDIIARLGGDEFVVLVPDASTETVERMRARLSENLERFNARGQQPYLLALSVGVSFYDPSHPESLDSLIASADQRMYEEKMCSRAPNSTRMQRSMNEPDARSAREAFGSLS